MFADLGDRLTDEGGDGPKGAARCRRARELDIHYDDGTSQAGLTMAERGAHPVGYIAVYETTCLVHVASPGDAGPDVGEEDIMLA